MPEGEFPSYAQSLAVYGDNKTIQKAKLTATYTGTVSFALGLSDQNDGTGISWETVDSGVEYTFIATGKWLYWKAVGFPGSIVSQILVEITQEA